jgi:outer membrane immunogenic protein
MIKRFSLTLLAATAIGVVVASQGASAADMGMPVKAPPVAPPVPMWNWTGLYAGGVFGVGISRNKLTDLDNNASNLADGLLCEGCSAGTFSQGGINLGTQIGVGPQGGFVLGYKWQAPNSPWVFGIDGQFSFADLQGSTSNSNSASVFFPKFTACFKSFRTCQVNVNTSTNVSSKVKDIATIAGLFGITSGPQDRTLWYVKGGAAWAKTAWSAADALNGSVVEFGVGGGIHPEDSGSVAATAFSSTNSSRWGWMVGTGVEWGLWGNWSAKIEYDFLDFGSYDVQLNGTANGSFLGFDGCGTNFGCSFSGSTNRTLHVDQQIHLVQVGLNYKFDWAGGKGVWH